MKKNIFNIFAIVGILILSACSSAPETKNLQVQSNCKFDDTNTIAPEWICNPSIDGDNDTLYAVGLSNNIHIALARSQARINAQNELGAQIGNNSNISQWAKDQIDQTTSSQQKEIVTKTVGRLFNEYVRTSDITGYKLLKYARSPNQTTYALISMSKKNINDIIQRKIQKTLSNNKDLEESKIINTYIKSKLK